MSDNFAYLTAEQRENLAALPFPVVLPGTLPAGWSVEALAIDSEDGETDLTLELTGASGTVVFLATDAGIGDAAPGETTDKIDHPDFGSLFVERYEEPDPDDFQLQWLEIEDCEARFSFRGSDISDSDFEALLGSLDLFEH